MENNVSGLSYLFKYRKLLFVSICIGGIIGYVLTYTMPKVYSSTALVYPYSSNNYVNKFDDQIFGGIKDVEQLTQLLKSKSMGERVVRRFKLYDYYSIDTTKKGWLPSVLKRYHRDVKTVWTKYLAISVTVTTTDPQLSADIANYTISEVNNYRQQIFKKNKDKQFQHLKEAYLASKKRVSALKDSIYTIKSDSSALLFNFIKSMNKKNYDTKEFVDDIRLEPFIENYIFEIKTLEKHRIAYEEMKVVLKKPHPAVYDIDQATPSYKHTSSSFKKNTMMGAFVFFILVLTIRLMIDKWNQLKKATHA